MKREGRISTAEWERLRIRARDVLPEAEKNFEVVKLKVKLIVNFVTIMMIFTQKFVII